jgi:hypothetical protein
VVLQVHLFMRHHHQQLDHAKGRKEAYVVVNGVADEEEDTNGVNEGSSTRVVALKVLGLVPRDGVQSRRALGEGTLGQLDDEGARQAWLARFFPLAPRR